MDERGEIGLGGGGGSEAGGAVGGPADGLDSVREGVAEDHGTPGAEEIEVAVAVFIVEPGAFGVSDEWRLAADGAKGAYGRVDSAGEDRFGLLLQKVRSGVGERHPFEY